MPAIFGFLDLGATELMVIGAIAVMLFGKNLPEVARSAGKHLGAFRKGIRGFEEEFRSTTGGLGIPTTRFTSALSTLDSLTGSNSSSSSTSTSSPSRSTAVESLADIDEPTAPKFEPPPG